ncbi:MAG: 4Fe-4S dicluster domain-containing protein [Proteocatella sp.]
MKKAIINSNQCVACGVCATKCPKDAISIFKGIKAVVDEAKCIGCSLCNKVCPANAVSIEISKNIKDEISA